MSKPFKFIGDLIEGIKKFFSGRLKKKAKSPEQK